MPLPLPRDRGAALVTGASSGIGEEFAGQLAGRGHNVVLVARRRDRLEALAQQLGPRGVRAEVLRADLADPEAVRSLPARVSELGLEVDVLVNNAGFGFYGPFSGSSLESQAGQVRLNVEALVTLTHVFLGAMVQRGAGTIINVASVAGFQPLPYEAVYSATKAFVSNFSEALHVETRGSGVSVLCVNPGPVPTEWQAIAGMDEQPRFPPPVSAAQVAREALEAADRDRRSLIPGMLPRIGMLATRAIPNTVKLPVIERMNKP